jgi:hypothetical protein
MNARSHGGNVSKALRVSTRRPRLQLGAEQLEPRLCMSAVTFLPHELGDRALDGAWDAAVADLNNDGHLDVLFAFYDHESVAWYANDGERGFTGPRTVGFVDDAGSVFAGDLDGDGDTDVVAGSLRDHGLFLFENIDGTGEFTEARVIDPSSTPLTVSGGDLDGDGDVDVVTQAAWYDNTDALGTMESHGLAGTLDGRDASVLVADVDGDGDEDILCAISDRRGNGVIAWQENIDGKASFELRSIASVSSNSVAVADLDSNGTLDIVASLAATHDHPGSSAILESGSIVWYSNADGLGTFSEPVVIDADVPDPISVSAGDIDNDGDIDVVASSDGTDTEPERIVWYANTDGHGAFGPANVVVEDMTTDDPATDLQSRHPIVVLADIDQDGDVDLLNTTERRGQVHDEMIDWYENVMPGDANRDGAFDHEDLVQVLQAGKYRTEDPAVWSEGDWNGDGVFDQLDIITALRIGSFQ